MQELFEPALLDALEESEHDLWEGHVWRQVVGATDPLRANNLGGRWNPPGVEVLYCSLSESGAEIELSAMLDRQPCAIQRSRLTHRLSIKLSRVGEVTESATFAAAGVSRDAVVGSDWSVPQVLGAASEWLGFTGLIVPSARHENSNLVIFVNKLGATDHYEIAAD